MSAAAVRRRLVTRGDVPGSNGGIYNPGALVDGDRILLLCRREIDYEFRRAFVFPELLTLDRRTLELLDYRTLAKVGYSHDTRLEDFRCLAFGDSRLVVHSVVRPDRIKPAISRMYADALQRYDDFALPIAPCAVEKNWVLFEHEGALHCLYKLDPLTIFVRTGAGGWQRVREEDNGWQSSFERTLSNSSNLVAVEDGYLGFWHSIIDGRYVQGAFLLDRTLTLQCTTGVLLDGIEITEGFKPGVLYVSAVVEDGDSVLAFYGEADAHTGVAVFNRDELLQELRRSPFSPVRTIRVRFDGASVSDAVRGMQRLRAFSDAHRRTRIRLFVENETLGGILRRLATPNIVVDERASAEVFDCTLQGASGSII